MSFDKLMWKAIPYAVAYGIGRKMLLLKGATIEERQLNPETGLIEYNKVPLLWTQKAAISVMSGVVVPSLLPYYVYEDVKRFERYIRGIPNKRESPWPMMTIDYVLM